MYERHFGLDRRPFNATPDPDCFVPTETAGNVLADLIRCVESAEGIAVLTGAAGVGKTLLCRRLAEELSEAFDVVLLPCANFPTRRSLLQAILFELERPYARMAEQELRLELISAIRELCGHSEALVLIVDEAHLLSARLLEEIRSITNLIDDGAPLVRVVLSGQLLLEENLAEPELASLNQRIACQVSLVPLSHKESAEYVNSRIEWSGGVPAELFAPRAMQIICQASDGSPRCLNQLCDHSLMLAYVAEQQSVSAEIVHEALDDLKQLPLHWNVPTAIPSPLEQLNTQAKQLREIRPSERTETRETPRETAPSREPVECIEIGGDEAAPTVAIEIGGPDEFASSAKQPATPKPVAAPALSADKPAKTSEAPLPPRANSKPTLSRDFVEEVVVDRYALLDAARPIVSLVAKKKDTVTPRAPLPAAKLTSKSTNDHTHTDRRIPTAEELDKAIEGIMLLVDDALDNSHHAGLTISVDTEEVRGLREPSMKERAVESRATVAAAESKPAFDVVLPEEDDDSDSDVMRTATAAEHPNEPVPPPRPHRPYEQLFSELRRRKGA